MGPCGPAWKSCLPCTYIQSPAGGQALGTRRRENRQGCRCSHEAWELPSILLLLLLSRFSHVRLYATPEMAAHQAPLSMGFSRQEYWSGLPLPSLCSSPSGPYLWSRHCKSRMSEVILTPLSFLTMHSQSVLKYCGLSTSSTCTSHVHSHRQQSISTVACSFKIAS